MSAKLKAVPPETFPEANLGMRAFTGLFEDNGRRFGVSLTYLEAVGNDGPGVHVSVCVPGEANPFRFEICNGVEPPTGREWAIETAKFGKAEIVLKAPSNIDTYHHKTMKGDDWARHTSARFPEVSVRIPTVTGERWAEGSFWVEAEQGYVRPGREWNWAHFHLADGRDVLWHRTTGAVVWTDGVAARDVDVTVLPATHGWDVSVGGEAYRVEAAHKGQEIVGDGFRYWDGLVFVGKDGEETGHGYIKHVPEAWGAPTEIDMFERWCLGDRAAFMLMRTLAVASQRADDFADNDVLVADMQEHMSALVRVMLIELPNNPFWATYRATLEPILAVSIEYWRASNRWAKSADRHQRMWGYVCREDMEHVFVMIAMIIGGAEHAQKVLCEMNEFYHVKNVDPFERWEKENE